MLPFLKNKQEASMAQEEDEPSELKFVDALSEDIMSAIKNDDKDLLKQALEALCEYIKAEDAEQDKNLNNKESQ